MGGILQPILALLLVFIREEAVRPSTPVNPVEALLGLLIYLALTVVTTRTAVRRVTSRADGAMFHLPPSLGILHFALFALLIWWTDWVGFVREVVTDWPVISTLIAFSPYMIAQGLKAALAYDALPADRRAPGKRRAMVVFQMRVLALPVVPIILISGLRRLVLIDDDASRYVEAYLPLLILVLLATVFFVFAIAPLLVRWIIFARPLTEGPLRQRLTAYCKRISFRPTDILIWRTGNTVTNALFIGILPFLRYVVLTDALVGRLEDEEVEAVFAHEAGHGSRRHTQLFLIFAAGFTVATMIIQQEMMTIGNQQVQMLLGPIMIAFHVISLVGFFLVFGWMSRRFETEADIFAIETLETPEHFPRALKSVGLHAGAQSRKGGMRHFGIGTRIGLINRYLAEPEFKEAFDRILKGCRFAIFALLVAGAAVLAIRGPQFMREGHVRLGWLTCFDAQSSNDPALAAKGLDLLRPYLEDPEFGADAQRAALACLWIMSKDALQKGDWQGAERHIATMRSTVPRPDRLGSFNLDFLETMNACAAGGGRVQDIEDLLRVLTILFDTVLTLDADSVYEDFSDLFLAQRAVGSPDVNPKHPGNLGDAASLLWSLDRIRRDGAAPPENLAELVARAEKDGVFRRRLFARATGGNTPREAASEHLDE